MARTHGKTTEIVLKEIQDIHGTKFIYDRFEYVNSHTKITLGCKTHGYFNKFPNDVKRKNGGCPRCNGSWTKTHQEFINELLVLHPGIRVLSGTYKNAKSPIEVLCEEHSFKFTSTPNGLLLGHTKCPECYSKKQTDTKVRRGQITDPALNSEYEIYKRAVWRHSNRAYKLHLFEQIRDRHNHLDHILSIVEGFKNKVGAEIIGSIHNLRIIPAKANRTKSYKSNITVEELLQKYKEQK
jgi:predicted Zn-ribbon and HTH transcriptional regulator